VKGAVPHNKGIKTPLEQVNKWYKSMAKPNRFQKGEKHLPNGKPRGLHLKGKKPHNFVDGRSKFLSPGRYGSDWNKIRRLVYERGYFLCQQCGKNEKENAKGLDVHHKIPFLISRNNSIENLISLCRRCHMVEENKIKNIYEQHKIMGVV
jgi:5-methylcytosine-specific restriction endonuclease McrA